MTVRHCNSRSITPVPELKFRSVLASLGLAVCLAMSACASKHQPADLQALLKWPQNPALTMGPEAETSHRMDQARQRKSAAFYRAMHYLPWKVDRNLYSVSKPLGDSENLRKASLFGENLRPRSRAWVEALIDECNWQDYPSVNRKGITLRTTNVRILPTHRPGFLDPDRAGQGYPFDHLQYSSLWANTPVHVSHRTKDRSWYFVETAHVFGWVRAGDLAFVSDDQAARITALPLTAIIRDRVAVNDSAGRFLFQARIGMLLPDMGAGGQGPTCLVLDSDENMQAVIREVQLEQAWAEPFPLRATSAKCARVARQFPGQPYGWGGLFQNRDCSAFIRDYLTPFGIWMPRNSAQQAKMGRLVDLKDSSPRDKERIIADRGVPFLSLVAMPGHIMLYIGSSQGRALVQHTMWGLRTQGLLGAEGRLVVGQNMISELNPGRSLSNLARPEGELLHRVTGLAILDTGVTEWPFAPFSAAKNCPGKKNPFFPDI